MIRFRNTITALLLSAVVAIGAGGCSMMKASSTVALTSKLSGASEVPANSTSGTGALEANFNKETNILVWKLTYTGLTGPAIAAHFHGPAAAGTNASVIVPITPPASPAEGQATLTAAQAEDLLAGKWYVNVHTASNKGGEIRGQVVTGM